MSVRIFVIDVVGSYTRLLSGFAFEAKFDDFARNGVSKEVYYYPDPERHVNRSKNPNVAPDFEREANIALCDIKKGEELSILDSTKEDF
jgi:hypothetical protein